MACWEGRPGSLGKLPLLSTAAMQRRTKLGTVSPSRWHRDSSWQPNTWSAEMQDGWPCHPQKLFSAQASTPKWGGPPGCLPVLGLGTGVRPPPGVSRSGESHGLLREILPRPPCRFLTHERGRCPGQQGKNTPGGRGRKASAGPAPSPRSRPRSCRLCKGGLLAISRFSLFRTRFCSVPSGQRPAGGRAGVRAPLPGGGTWKCPPPPTPEARPPRPPLTGAPAAAETQQRLGHRLRLLFLVLPGAQLPQLRWPRARQAQLQGVLPILDPGGCGGREEREERREACTPSSSQEALLGCGGRGSTPQPHPGSPRSPPRPPLSLSPGPPTPRPPPPPSHQALDDRPQRVVPGAQLGLQV